MYNGSEAKTRKETQTEAEAETGRKTICSRECPE